MMAKLTETQELYWKRGEAYRKAMVDTARRLGPKHRLTQLMGARAWGRSEFELMSSRTAYSYIRYAVGLEAMFLAYRDWCAIYDSVALLILLAALTAARAEVE